MGIWKVHPEREKNMTKGGSATPDWLAGGHLPASVDWADEDLGICSSCDDQHFLDAQQAHHLTHIPPFPY